MFLLKNAVMSNVVDFARQKDLRSRERKSYSVPTALLLEVSKDMFNPFSAFTFILLNPDVDSAILKISRHTIELHTVDDR